MGKNRENKRIIEIQKKRALIIDLIREFFKKRGFLEVQTPILTKGMSTEPYIDPIKVEFFDDKNKKYQGYLITSPEYSLKKLLSLGFPNIFEITKAFRQRESFGKWHNLEFTILEWYRVHSDYKDMMKDTEELVNYLVKKLFHRNFIIFQNQKIDLSLPWQRLSIKEAFLKWANIDLDKNIRLKNFKETIKKKEYAKNIDLKFFDWNDCFYFVFLNEIEKNLPRNKAIILYDYPLPQAALAKRKSKNSFYAERFEAYIGGIEICNAFSELTDWQEQLKRLKEDQKTRKKLKKEFIPIDKTFICALKSKLPPLSGNALGVERLEMLLLDIKNIDELLPFSINKMFNSYLNFK
ncbi:MAG: EF-P lysine aminoacylase EpmA [Minisyncoccia bacterium]|jgi:lysyl-tRNA synthetase class 2